MDKELVDFDQTKKNALDLLIFITRLGAGVEASMIPETADALRHFIEGHNQPSLTKKQQHVIRELILQVEGRLGEPLADLITRMLSQTGNWEYRTRLANALNYLQEEIQ